MNINFGYGMAKKNIVKVGDYKFSNMPIYDPNLSKKTGIVDTKVVSDMLPNLNIAEQLMDIDASGLCVMVAYIICGLRQLGGKVTFGEECVDRYEYQFATKLVEKLDASELNVLISHIAAGLNRIGGKVSFDE